MIVKIQPRHAFMCKMLVARFLPIVSSAIIAVSPAHADPLSETRIFAKSLKTNAEVLAFLKTVSFSVVKSVKVAKIDSDYWGSTPRFHDDLDKPKFHGFTLVSEWLPLDDSSDAGLSQYIRKNIEIWTQKFGSAGKGRLDELDANPFCTNRADYAVHLETDKGGRDFLITLNNGNLFAYDDKNHGMQFQTLPYAGIEMIRFYEIKFPGNVPLI